MTDNEYVRNQAEIDRLSVLPDPAQVLKRTGWEVVRHWTGVASAIVSAVAISVACYVLYKQNQSNARVARVGTCVNANLDARNASTVNDRKAQADLNAAQNGLDKLIGEVVTDAVIHKSDSTLLGRLAAASAAKNRAYDTWQTTLATSDKFRASHPLGAC